MEKGGNRMPQGGSNGNGSSNGKAPKKGPRFNLYWVYAIIGIVLLSMNFFGFHNKPKEISFQDFSRNLLANHDVQKLVVVNKSDVEVYIKPDKLNEPQFKDVAHRNLGTLNTGPHYHFTIGDLQTFQQNLEAAEK